MKPLFPRFVFAIVFTSLAVTTGPGLLDLAKRAHHLRGLPYEKRRAEVNGEVYTSAKLLDQSFPPNDPLALVTAGSNGSYAIFGTYYLYPRPTRQYGGFDVYRLAASDPNRPKTIILAESRLTPVSYEEVRDARLRQRRVVHAKPSGVPRAEFVIPFAACGDGVPPNAWVTEADFANENNATATVRMEFHAPLRAKTITIAPHAAASFYDLVYEMFRHVDTGWIHVKSSLPLRTSVWFVNRGNDHVAPIPLVDAKPNAGTIICPSECKAWLLNLADRDNVAHLTARDVALKPNELKFVSFTGAETVNAADVFAFASTKEETFVWPNGVTPQ